MPPGEIRCWIFAAACDGAGASAVNAKQVATMNAMRRAQVGN